MRISFSIFGCEVWAFEAQPDDPADVLAEAIAELAEDPEEEAAEMVGGAGQNFERDVTPLDPNERYAPWEDRGFGFQARRDVSSAK